jgi:hypothetical protein
MALAGLSVTRISGRKFWECSPQSVRAYTHLCASPSTGPQDNCERKVSTPKIHVSGTESLLDSLILIPDSIRRVPFG